MFQIDRYSRRKMVGFGHGHNHENVSIGRTCYLSMCEHLFVVVSLVYFFFTNTPVYLKPVLWSQIHYIWIRIQKCLTLDVKWV